MKKYSIILTVLMIWIIFTLIFHVPQPQAQWVEQSFTLKPGWNAVYLEVEPQPGQCEEVFRDLPIASVWTWNPKSSKVEYIQNPDTLVPKQPQWMVYFPSSIPESFLTNLFIVMGGRAYLINMNSDKPVEWKVLGRPCLPKITWKHDSFNFVGFHLMPGEEPFFESFFSASSAHAGQEIYRLNDDDIWERVAHPSFTSMRHGEAYWVYCKGYSDYAGPLVCQVEQGKKIDYGRVLVEQGFRIRNLAKHQTTVSLKILGSEGPMDINQSPVAGNVPLSYWHFEPEINEADWIPLPDPLSFSIKTGQEKLLRLAVNRSEMPATGICQSILEVKNEMGARVLVPVSANGSGQYAANLLKRKRKRFKDLDNSIRHVGLWVGSALINGVSQPADPNDPDDPNKRTDSEFQFRLIIHVDENGQIRLLREVIQMWAEGIWKPDPNNPKIQIVDQPGRLVLLTDDSLIYGYKGAGIRGGQPVGRRISSAAFSFSDPVDMEGSFYKNGKLSCSITIYPDDPLNPFKHKYHPDHDNLDAQKENYKLEAYEVIREIELEFTAYDPLVPENTKIPGGSDTEMGGIYREAITGLHKQKIYTKGVFRLHRVSPVASLNDEAFLGQ